MKKLFSLFALSFASSTVFAYDYVARVIDVQPRYQTIYQQKCHSEIVGSNNSTLGTVIGGVAGGIIGNQVGGGSGRDAATVIGAIVGAGVGNRIGSDQQNYQTRNVCNTVPVSVRRGEVVTFEYRGRRFTVTYDD